MITAEGKILVFGTNINARIADPESGQKIYAWMIEEERDIFGHSIRYEYTQNG